MNPTKLKPSTDRTRLRDREFLLSKVESGSFFIWLKQLGVDRWVKLFTVTDLGVTTGGGGGVGDALVLDMGYRMTGSESFNLGNRV